MKEAEKGSHADTQECFRQKEPQTQRTYGRNAPLRARKSKVVGTAGIKYSTRG